jgi:hypothetical protein
MKRLAAGLFVTLSAAAADLSGTWTGQIPARNNELQDLTFRLVQKGTVLTGKLYRDTTAVPVLDGTISGDSIYFRVESEEQVGNIFVLIRYKFTGTVKGTEIELTREREANPMLNSANPANRATQRPVFTLRRLF